MRAPPSIAVFNNLSNEDVENMVERTQCLIYIVKEEFKKLLECEKFDVDSVLQFALDPANKLGLELSSWHARKLDGDWILIEMDTGSGAFVVKDAPTKSLLDFVFGDGVEELNDALAAGGSGSFRKTPLEFDDDAYLSAKEIKENFGIERTTLQSWIEEEKGEDEDKLEALEAKKKNGKVYCRFGDLKPFLRRWIPKSGRKKK